MMLSNPAGAGVGLANAILTIVDAESPTVLQFSSATYRVNDVEPEAHLPVVRSGGMTPAVSCEFRTADGTGRAGINYLSGGGGLGFGIGVRSRPVPVTILTAGDGDKTVEVSLSSPTDNAFLGVRSRALLTIADRDTAGTLQFDRADLVVSETETTATITVVRSGGTGTASVHYSVYGGTASPSLDYVPVHGASLTLGPGQMSGTFAVTLKGNTTPSNNRSVGLSLGSPGNGVKLGERSSATLWIVNN